MAGTKVAVDFGGSSIRAVQFTTGKKSPRIDKIAMTPLPEDVISDGEVVDAEALGQLLKQMWREAKLGSKDVIFGVSNDSVVSRMADFEWLPDKEFGNALRYQASGEHVEYAPDEAVWKYHSLNEFSLPARDSHDPEAMQRIRQIVLVAAKREMIDGFVTAVRAAGLHPSRAEFTPFALIRAALANLHEIQPAEDTAETIVDIGADMTNIVIHHAGQPLLVRPVAGSAGRRLTTFLAGQFTNWTTQDAEATKISLGLGTNTEGPQHPAQEVINHVVGAQIQIIRETVEFVLSSSPQISGMHRLMLTGGGANLKGLPQRLASELRVPVVVGAPVHNLPTAKNLVIPEGLAETQLSVSLGLALGA